MTQHRIVVAEDESIVRLDLKEMLENQGYLVVGEATDGKSAVNLARELKPDLLLTAFSDREFVDRARESGVMGYIVKPFGEAELVPAIEVALARFQEFRSLEQELGDTRDALETRKLVERAKGVLMDAQGLKETDAFRKIQKLSMNSRKSMREVAEAILLAHDVSA